MRGPGSWSGRTTGTSPRARTGTGSPRSAAGSVNGTASATTPWPCSSARVLSSPAEATPSKGRPYGTVSAPEPGPSRHGSPTHSRATTTSTCATPPPGCTHRRRSAVPVPACRGSPTGSTPRRSSRRRTTTASPSSPVRPAPTRRRARRNRGGPRSRPHLQQGVRSQPPHRLGPRPEGGGEPVSDGGVVRLRALSALRALPIGADRSVPGRREDAEDAPVAQETAGADRVRHQQIPGSRAADPASTRYERRVRKPFAGIRVPSAPSTLRTSRSGARVPIGTWISTGVPALRRIPPAAARRRSPSASRPVWSSVMPTLPKNRSSAGSYANTSIGTFFSPRRAVDRRPPVSAGTTGPVRFPATRHTAPSGPNPGCDWADPHPADRTPRTRGRRGAGRGTRPGRRRRPLRKGSSPAPAVNGPRPVRRTRTGPRSRGPRPVHGRGRGNDSSAAARPEASVPILR
ncbi:hypothetical protein RKD28_006318 [Streptomyces sp. SAI-229]